MFFPKKTELLIKKLCLDLVHSNYRSSFMKALVD
ncbi:hypothetical protein PaelaDRAFT_3860 [Paenibacillus lactis 154]|uniref:Uncharacterized protein n=1 Tax=Paenibacillus lactis 154 TaxID=743719 RepID=G4HIP9_9BACL|nr:hypothetical protein PaelaDRAFT_3860 [Paenibacillus lactis 154]